MMSQEFRFENDDGSFAFWIEQEAIHMKVRENGFDDAVELTVEEARKVAQMLLAYADAIDGFDK
jgi:hypothetical protein